jgi:hypothetical protein
MEDPHSLAFAGGVGKEEEPALDPKYLESIARLEALPENQSGADKTWIEEAVLEFARHYAKAKRVR